MGTTLLCSLLESCMKKVMRLSDIFPLLSRLAEVGLALPVSNAWPER